MGLNKFFFDSYAVIEILKGNPNYAKYVQEEVILTQFNLVEIYFSALTDLSETGADEIFKKYRDNIVDIDDDSLKEATRFRRKVYKEKKISYTDAIGYIYAKRNGLIFLTGDKEFKDLDNVEFVR